MTQAEVCGCKGRCDTRRCRCLKNDQPCGDACKCEDCQNPLNGLDVQKMTACAIQHAEACRSLTESDLAKEIEMPCGHGPVKLKELIDGYRCGECGDEQYFYSFCWRSAEQNGCTWHYRICGKCRDWQEWHCDQCNRCTYGVTSPCENCSDSDSGFDSDFGF